MYYVNKIVWFFANPLSVAVLLAVLAPVALRLRFRRTGLALAIAVPIWLWSWSSPWMTALAGLPLEMPYLDGAMEKDAASFGECDAIVLLGGGIGAREDMRYPNMYSAADRVWQAARLYKAGRAPFILASGCGDLRATVPLLLEFGVPRAAIEVDNESRNTYENARFTERFLKEKGKPAARVLLVTSAWHMTRSLGNFSRTGLKTVPAACDFDAVYAVRSCRAWDFVLPSIDVFFINSCFAKEWLGRLARK